MHSDISNSKTISLQTSFGQGALFRWNGIRVRDSWYVTISPLCWDRTSWWFLQQTRSSYPCSSQLMFIYHSRRPMTRWRTCELKRAKSMMLGILMPKSTHSCPAWCTSTFFHLHQNSDHQGVEQAPLKPERELPTFCISWVFKFTLLPAGSWWGSAGTPHLLHWKSDAIRFMTWTWLAPGFDWITYAV
jgi:hypothetical protein